jgi:hypothetical protein
VYRRQWLCILVAAATGCSFNSNYDGTHYQCAADGTCPGGQTCVSNVCVAGEGPDAGPGQPVADAPPGSVVDAPIASMGLPGCGSMGLLVDGFDAQIFPVWFNWSTGSGTASITGGRMIAKVPTGTGSQSAGIGSRFFFDLSNAQLETTVSQVGGTDTILEARSVGGGKLQLLVENGALMSAVFGVTGEGTRASTVYDPSTQKRWRIRENTGVVYFEWSTDGAAWHELSHEADPFPVTSMQAWLSAAGPLASPSEAHFEEVNLNGPSVPGFCPASELSDDFQNGTFEPLWNNWYDTPATVAETGGKVVFTFPSPGTGDVWAGIESRHLFDLSNSTVYVDMGSVPRVDTMVSFFQVDERGDAGGMLEFQVDGTTLSLTEYKNGATVSRTSLTYDPTAHRFWRFRGDGTKVYWDASPDGSNWTQLKSLTPQIDLHAMLVAPGAGHYPPGPGVAEVTSFAGLNTP